MPARGHTTAPKFEGNNPRELQRYFDELDYLFATCTITGEVDRKKYAVRYLDIDTEDVWKQLPEYSSVFSTYNGFKAAVLKLYPGADGDRKWTLTDLDTLIGEWTRIGFRNKEDLGDYHRKFLVISGFLKSKNRMSDNEIKRTFVRGFPIELWLKVLARLQIKYPAHHPDDPWGVDEVFEAGEFVLHGTSSFATASSAQPQKADAPVKKEELYTIMEQFSQTITKALEAKLPPPQNAARIPNKPRTCFYDGCNRKSFDCETLKKHLELGYCRRNEDRKLVFPDGSWIMRSLPGKNMAERVEKFHAERSVKKTATMFYDISEDDTPIPLQSLSAYAQQHQPLAQPPQHAQEPHYKRIEELEREVYSLRRHQVMPQVMESVEIPRPAYNTRRTQPPPQEQQALHLPQTIAQPAQATQVAQPTKTAQPTQIAQAAPPTPTSAPSQIQKDKAPPRPSAAKTSAPIHPYAAAAGNSYLPPHERNFATSQAKDSQGAYRTTAPIQSSAIIDDIFSKTMKSQCVTLTPEEIMSVAPDVRAKIREVITPRRIPSKPPPQAANHQARGGASGQVYAHIDEGNDSEEEQDGEREGSPITTQSGFEVLPFNDENPQEAIIIPDPVDQYLQNLPPDEIPKQFKVAKDSFSLRSIHVRVHYKDTIECVVDAGSCIISMSEAACLHLKLHYDPSVFISMESANGTLDRTLGLARNVHCKIGGINLFLQIHIVRNPAYDMLLGRPFDVLTRSTVQNFVDGNQTITLYDPNSDYVCTIPTFPRTRRRFTIPRDPALSQEESAKRDFH
jgi:hypothetical protein